MTDAQHAKRIRKRLAELHSALDAATKDGITFFASTDESGNGGKAPRFSLTMEREL